MSSTRIRPEHRLLAVLVIAPFLAGLAIPFSGCSTVTPKPVLESAPATQHSTKVAGGRLITAEQQARYDALIKMGYGTPKYHILPALEKDEGVQVRPDGSIFIDDQHARWFEQMSINYNSSFKR